MPHLAPPKQCVIADDVRASRETIEHWLSECGFECRMAKDGRAAWELIEDQPPDLLVTDLEMPKLCGLELLEKIRHSSDESIRALPVMVMTSLHDGQTLDIVRRLGGDGLLQKPLDKKETLSVILDLVLPHNITPQDGAQQIWHPGDDTGVEGEGVISPTLRRLLKTVARFE